VTKNPKQKRLIVNAFIILFLIAGTFVAIQFAKGYRPDLEKGALTGTGLLNVTSYPKSARVIINDKLTTVTDDKLYLTPATYNIKIEKDGFHPWTKTLPIKPELVTSADARLFPIITATSPITFYQATNAVVSPDGSKIAYVLKNAPQDTTNGIYVNTIAGNILGSSNVQITENSPKDFSTALLVWSPDNSQILAVFTDKPLPTKSNPKPTEKITSAYLLSTKSLNSKNVADVTVRIPLIIQEWQDQYTKINQPTLALYPKYISDILINNSINVYFSPDKEKVLYTATLEATLPENDIAKSLPNINSTTESRNIAKNNTYVFDLKEGTNYLLPIATRSSEIAKQIILSTEATPTASLSSLNQIKIQADSRATSNLSWYSNSRQLIATNNEGVNIIDYDGQNLTNITYVKPQNGFVVPSLDGSKLILLTNINQKPETFNLISFDLK